VRIGKWRWPPNNTSSTAQQPKPEEAAETPRIQNKPEEKDTVASKAKAKSGVGKLQITQQMRERLEMNLGGSGPSKPAISINSSGAAVKKDHVLATTCSAPPPPPPPIPKPKTNGPKFIISGLKLRTRRDFYPPNVDVEILRREKNAYQAQIKQDLANRHWKISSEELNRNRLYNNTGHFYDAFILANVNVSFFGIFCVFSHI